MRLFKKKGRKSSQKAVDSTSSTETKVEPEEASRDVIQPPAEQLAPFRTSFLQSARNVGISGGQFTSTAGHHTNLTINFHQGGIEPVLQVQPDVDIPGQPIVEEKLPNPIESPRENPDLVQTERVMAITKSSTPPTPKSSDIYYRHLSVKELGYPLWYPEPNNRLPIKYQRRGIQIGDVGIITPSGCFDFLFNICIPATDPMNPRELPEQFAPLHPPLDPADTRGRLQFKPNSYLASASIERSQREDNADIRNFAFESSASEGAILTMPDGAYLEELGNVARFRKYLAANAEHWYRYVNGVRGREALNGDVRLVIGCHKTTTWGMATFSDLREQKEFRLQFRPTGDDSRAGSTYGWEYSGVAEVRAGPAPQEIEELRMAEESEVEAIYRNQCLFVRALNVTLRDDIWKHLLSELDLGFDLDNCQPEDFDATGPQSPSSNNSTSAAKGKGPVSQPHFQNVLATNAFKHDVHTSGMERVLTQHPSKAINEMLLAKYPKARMAITEDSDWMAVLREDDTTLPSPEVLCRRIRAAYNTSYDPVDGVVSLQAKNFVSKFVNDPFMVLTHPTAPTSVNSSPSNQSATLSGLTLDNRSPSNSSGKKALRPVDMNRPPSYTRPLSSHRFLSTKIFSKTSFGSEEAISPLPSPTITTILPKSRVVEPHKPPHYHLNALGEDGDPFAFFLRPPLNETTGERAARETREAEAKRISDNIDDDLKAEKLALKGQRHIVRVLLLGQAESGKSTTIKNFLMKYSRRAWDAERGSWRAVIQLNIIQSITTIMETLQAEIDGDPVDDPLFTPAPALLTHSNNNSKTSSTSISSAFAVASPDPFQPNDTSPSELDATSSSARPNAGPSKGSLSTPLTEEHRMIKLRLGPLKGVETDLKRRLGAGAEEEVKQDGVGTAGVILGPLGLKLDSQSLAHFPKKEFSVPRLHEALQKGLLWPPTLQDQTDHGHGRPGLKVDGIVDESTEVIAACLQDMKALWTDEVVRAMLRKRNVRIEDTAGFFLDDLDRIARRDYEPSDDDVIRARLRTVGVQEYKIRLNYGTSSVSASETTGDLGREWLLYDVGGSRTVRHAWIPFFENIQAILFLAPVSCFDECLSEDPSVNRLEDSFLLWHSVCSSRLLSKTQVILFLNKCDLLERKLRSGVMVKKYVPGFGDRPNDVQNVVKYLKEKFKQVLKKNSPEKRSSYIYSTSVIDIKATSLTIAAVRDSVMRDYLNAANLV